MTNEPSSSEDAILKATGRAWREWFATLRGAGMNQRSREELIVFLREQHGVPAWWQQLIVDAFEKEIGRSNPVTLAEGPEVTIRRVLDLPAAVVHAAWAEEDLRAKWLRKSDFSLETLTAPRTLRGKWMPDGSQLEIDVAPETETRSILSLRQTGLANADVAARMRLFWGQSIDRMVQKISK